MTAARARQQPASAAGGRALVALETLLEAQRRAMSAGDLAAIRENLSSGMRVYFF